GSGLTPTHAYSTAGTFITLMVATDEAGQSSTATQSVPVLTNPPTPPPTADFVFSPPPATTGASVLFHPRTPPAATHPRIQGYSWNFGDGGTATGQTPTHTFGSAGTFAVVLVITDDLGQSGTSSKTVQVTSTNPTPPPFVDFVFSPTNPAVSTFVAFNASL